MTRVKTITRTHWVYHVFVDKFVCIPRPYVSVVCSIPAIICVFWIYNKKVHIRYCFPSISCYLGEVCFHETYAYSLSLNVTYFSLAPSTLTVRFNGYIVPVAFHILFPRYQNFDINSQTDATPGSSIPNTSI